MSNKYDDIINLPRPESKYPRMPRANRAAQFSPFAALTGHEEAIRETAYLVEALSNQDEPVDRGVEPCRRYASTERSSPRVCLETHSIDSNAFQSCLASIAAKKKLY